MLLVPAAFALGAVLTYAVTFWQLPATEDPGAWGAFGDFLGGLLNPLVSTLTLFVAASVWKLQRKELELTREELAQTKLAMEEQAKTAEQQRQEQRFFDLLGIYQTTVASITLVARMSHRSEEHLQYTGKEAIAKFFRNSSEISNCVDLLLEKGFYESPKKDPSTLGGMEILKEEPTDFSKSTLIQAWGQEATADTFDHYFRVLFRVLAESESLLGDQHFKYVKLLRAQLSSYELMLIGLNMWLDEEGKKMIPLAKKYGLLKHMRQNKLREQLQAELPPAVFGQRFVAENRSHTPGTPARD